MSEKEKMLAGQVYSADDGDLLRELADTRELVHRYNSLSPSLQEERLGILKDLLGGIGDEEIIINQPFFCDYGKQIRVGKRFFANFHFTVLDEAPVTIGAGSVVTHDIPSDVVAVGNPCKVLRSVL